jgi:uncharacterized membrane protein
MNRITKTIKSLQITDWLAIAMLLIYVVLFSTLRIRQHQSFNTNALDLAKFDQSIWNTSRGRPFQISIGENLVINSHFSPSLALFAPLYWLWPDIRLLLIVQSLLLGGAGFLIYWFFRREKPWLGLIVFAAYLLHPALHQVNLAEFRRWTLAVFATSFTLYHMLRRNYGWMALGLAVALLSKEDMAFVAIAVGLYILILQRSAKIGITTTLIGLTWLILIPFALLPALMTQDAAEGYQHAVNYSYLGSSLPEILRTVTTDPGILWQVAGEPIRLTAVFNFIWPSAFIFLLAPELALFLLPHLGFLLSSTRESMGELRAWYPSIPLILLFWAVAVGAARLSGRWQKIALGALLVAATAAWLSSSRLWPGPRFDAQRYQISEHERQVSQALRVIPPEAIVMAQDPLVPHLSHRQEIYLYPWVRNHNQPAYVVLDRDMRTYPLGPDEYRSQFYDYLAGVEYEIADQIDSFYLFEYTGQVQPEVVTDFIWDEAMQLHGYAVAAAPPGEGFSSANGGQLPAGSTLRVSLFWEMTGELDQNYTVFVHAVTPDGRLLGQHDSWPADTHRPTSVLAPGEQVRDVHYLTLNEAVNLEDITLRVGVYESISGTTIPQAGHDLFVTFPAIDGATDE